MSNVGYVLKTHWQHRRDMRRITKQMEQDGLLVKSYDLQLGIMVVFTAILFVASLINWWIG